MGHQQQKIGSIQFINNLFIINDQTLSFLIIIYFYDDTLKKRDMKYNAYDVLLDKPPNQ